MITKTTDVTKVEYECPFKGMEHDKDFVKFDALARNIATMVGVTAKVHASEVPDSIALGPKNEALLQRVIFHLGGQLDATKVSDRLGTNMGQRSVDSVGRTP